MFSDKKKKIIRKSFRHFWITAIQNRCRWNFCVVEMQSELWDCLALWQNDKNLVACYNVWQRPRTQSNVWAASWQNQHIGFAPSEDWDQPGHPPSLIRVFVVRMKTHLVLSYPLSAQRRLWSDWADAQADLSLPWAHRPICWFCRAAAHK